MNRIGGSKEDIIKNHKQAEIQKDNKFRHFDSKQLQFKEKKKHDGKRSKEV